MSASRIVFGVVDHKASVDRLAHFDTEPNRPDLERFFFLDDEDRRLIDKRRGDHNRLGFALQLTTVRYIGAFLSDPLEVPWLVVDYLAEQLGIDDASVVKRYTERLKTVYEHAWEIQVEQCWRDFFKDEQVQMAAASPPGPVVLRAEVDAPRGDGDRAVQGPHEPHRRRGGGLGDDAMPARLGGLLAVPVGARFSELERLRRPPQRTTGKAMVDALDRANDVFFLGAGKAQLQQVPTNRVNDLADVGIKAKAAHIAQMAEPHRTATLVATARHLEVVAVDDALDLFHALMATRLIAKARREAETQRLEALPRLDGLRSFHTGNDLDHK